MESDFDFYNFPFLLPFRIYVSVDAYRTYDGGGPASHNHVSI